MGGLRRAAAGDALDHPDASYLVSAFLEPGVYTFEWAYFFDEAGNVVELDKEALAALGKTSFTVKNTKGSDGTPPSLLRGKVLTPEVSLSVSQPGTDSPPFIGITIDAKDDGNTALAGVRSARANFCLLDGSRCLVVTGDSAGQPRQAKVTQRLGDQLEGSVVPGVYHLQVLVIYDYAFNSQFLSSTLIGGDTDFSTYFPSTTITIKP